MDRDLNDIAVFTAVVEARSFTKAGMQLGMPRSSVSRRIAQLEKRLGARLLHRTTRKLQLTDLGSAYFEQCARSLAEIDEAEQMVMAAQAIPRGRLKVTAPVDLGVNLLAPIITEFTQRYPEVFIEVELTQRVVDLVGEGFDLALRAGSMPDSTLVARRIAGGSRRLMASPEYLERRGAPASPQDLRDHCCILANDGAASPTWKLIGNGEEVEVPVAGAMRVNDFTFARSAAVQGAGIGFLPVFLCRDDLEAGRLQVVLGAYRSEPGNLWVVYPSARHMSATVRAFRDFVVEHRQLQERFVDRCPE